MTQEIDFRGCGVLFFQRARNAVLLFRRDDKPTIPFPNMLDILGGHVEAGETPDEAIVREMREELRDTRTQLPFELRKHQLFRRYVDARRCEQSIYYLEVDFETDDLELLEGRELVWLSAADLEQGRKLAFDFEDVVREFFAFIEVHEKTKKRFVDESLLLAG